MPIPFEHDESAMPASRRQQRVPTGQQTSEQAKDSVKKRSKHEYKTGGSNLSNSIQCTSPLPCHGAHGAMPSRL